MPYIPSRGEIKSSILEKLDKESNLYAELPKTLYAGAKYKIDLDITGEAETTQTKRRLLHYTQSFHEKAT